MKYEHKGVEITFGAGDAQFRATVPGHGSRIMAPSLDAAKKQIDKALETTGDFKPFNYIEVEDGKIVVSNVTAIRKRESRSYGSEYEFVTQENGKWSRQGSTASVIPDTPENRKKLLAYEALEKHNRAQIAKLEKEFNEARPKLPWLRADDVAVRKVKS